MDYTDETTSLISSRKVVGTNVYNTSGDHLGQIHAVMIDKHSGHVAYALISFGGVLGVGEKYQRVPWSGLKYDTRQGGYVVGITIQQLEDQPAIGQNVQPA
jgi:sporulation protein YlmC with PRC-barrel domain